MEIVDRLNEIFREVFLDDALVLHEEATADDVEGWDSFTHLNLVLALETHFGIAIGDDEAPGLKSVQAMVDLLRRKLAEGRGGVAS